MVLGGVIILRGDILYKFLNFVQVKVLVNDGFSHKPGRAHDLLQELNLSDSKTINIWGGYRLTNRTSIRYAGMEDSFELEVSFLFLLIKEYKEGIVSLAIWVRFWIWDFQRSRRSRTTPRYLASYLHGMSWLYEFHVNRSNSWDHDGLAFCWMDLGPPFGYPVVDLAQGILGVGPSWMGRSRSCAKLAASSAYRPIWAAYCIGKPWVSRVYKKGERDASRIIPTSVRLLVKKQKSTLEAKDRWERK